jgi:hypothetical protein
MPSSKIKSTISNTSKVGYLEKTDPIYQAIANRIVGDFQESAKKSDPESLESKAATTKMETWPQAKKDEFQTLAEKSINDYASEVNLDVSTFLSVLSSSLGTDDPKKILAENDIRIQYLGDSKYVAEFWEDGLAINSEANALIRSQELKKSEAAKKYPNVGDLETIKKTFADARKSIEDGKQEQYSKIMALLYTLEKDGSITFHDPGQPMFDFVK